RSGNPPEFHSHFRPAEAALEAAVHDLLSTGWDESRRRRAHQMAVALWESSEVAGWNETAGRLQALAALLALPLIQVLSIRDVVREKLLALLNLLGEPRMSDSA